MPNADELRDLIRQVADRGGPLRFFTDSEGVKHITWDDHDNRESTINSVEVAWLSEPDSATFDALAGVLRRDMGARGLYVIHKQFPATGSHYVQWHDQRDDFGSGRNSYDGTPVGVLEAHVTAWLDAAEVLEWRRVPPRDDLYDSRMPREDDE